MNIRTAKDCSEIRGKIMKLKDFDYKLPKNLIAQYPKKPRDYSRLLVVHKCAATNCVHANKQKEAEIEHKHFYDIADYLQPGDALVLNNSKVMPARLIGRKAETGGKIEVFLCFACGTGATNAGHANDVAHANLIANVANGASELNHRRRTSLKTFDISAGEVWQCLLGGHGRKEKLKIFFRQGLEAEVLKNNGDGTWNVAFNKKGLRFMKIIKKIGQTPLPPYIKRVDPSASLRIIPSASLRFAQDKQNYQTVYADEKKLGSVAAPTAGLHFTPRLLRKLKKKGVKIIYATLHVGLGTFAPVKVDDIIKHKMHAEWVEVKKGAIKEIVKAKEKGGRIIAVGTTSARALEAAFKAYNLEPITHNSKKFQASSFKFQDISLRTDIFIYPGYKFKAIDALITNFHLPKSTLLMLVSAFACAERSRSAGLRLIKKAYREAIRKKYRFYSYGDAMFIY